jgi:hypothetical protein
MTSFTILGEVKEIEVIARDREIRSRDRLQKKYGPGNRRKMKGKARVQLIDGEIRRAEIHWYEANGIGKRDFKIKKNLD